MNLDRRAFLVGTAAVVALPLAGCGGAAPLPPVSRQSMPQAMTRDGRQFQARPNEHVLVVSDPSGLRKRVGGVGSALGRLNYPTEVVTVGGLAYVLETGNHRVQVFDAEGRSLGSFGENILSYPGGITAVGDVLVVSDSRNGRLAAFTASGQFMLTAGEGVLSAPRGLGMAGDALLVADPGLRKVLRFGLDGRLQAEVGGDWVLPYDVASDGSLIFVADHSTQEVAVLDMNGVRLEGIAHHKAPSHVSYVDGRLYVV